MRALTVFVIVMGVVIILGFGVVAAVIAGRMSRVERPAGAAAGASSFATGFDLPRGARIAAMTTAPDRLILQLALPDGASRARRPRSGDRRSSRHHRTAPGPVTGAGGRRRCITRADARRIADLGRPISASRAAA